MKNKVLILFALSCIFISKVDAQNVGINGTGAAPAASAGLDVAFTDRGLLIPRVALTATNAAGPITTPATSLLVYNTATAGTAPTNVTPGYYFWTGTAWTRLSNGTQGGWDLQGNAGTAPANNFLGTTDATDLVLRTNNTERFRIQNNIGGRIQVGNADSGVFRATKELVFRQEGDQFGSSVLRLRNRNGENGAIFQTEDPTIVLVDFIFRAGTGGATTSNIRMEGRSSAVFTGNTPEWEFGTAADPTFVVSHGTGTNPTNSALTVVRKGRMGIGSTFALTGGGPNTLPTALLHLGAGVANAGFAPLKFTSGTNLATPEDGAVEYDGTNYFVTSGGTRYTMAKVLTGTASINFASTTNGNNGAGVPATITVTGAAVGDLVLVSGPTTAANTFFVGQVLSANTVTVRFYNNSGGTIDLASGTYRATVFKF